MSRHFVPSGSSTAPVRRGTCKSAGRLSSMPCSVRRSRPARPPNARPGRIRKRVPSSGVRWRLCLERIFCHGADPQGAAQTTAAPGGNYECRPTTSRKHSSALDASSGGGRHSTGHSSCERSRPARWPIDDPLETRREEIDPERHRFSRRCCDARQSSWARLAGHHWCDCSVWPSVLAASVWVKVESLNPGEASRIASALR